MFIHFDVGQHACSTDYITIDNEKACGRIDSGKVRTYRFENAQKYIYFRGDLGNGIGYHIRGRQVECPAHFTTLASRYYFEPRFAPYYREPLMTWEKDPGLPLCDQIFTETRFGINSPNYPNDYPPSIICQFIIKRPSFSVTAIEITFKTFDIEDSVSCSKDYLEIDGSKICGILPPNHQSKWLSN